MANPRGNIGTASDPLAVLQDPVDVFHNPRQLLFVRILVEAIRSVFRSVLHRDSGNPHILLTSPDGKVWRVTVSDAGTLVVANARS